MNKRLCKKPIVDYSQETNARQYVRAANGWTQNLTTSFYEDQFVSIYLISHLHLVTKERMCYINVFYDS